MNIQAETNEDEDKDLVYNNDEARVLSTVITKFNECMEHTVEEQGLQYVVTYSLKAGINFQANNIQVNFVSTPKPPSQSKV